MMNATTADQLTGQPVSTRQMLEWICGLALANSMPLPRNDSILKLQYSAISAESTTQADLVWITGVI